MFTNRFAPKFIFSVVSLLSASPLAFATGGIETIAIGPKDDRAFCSALQPDNKLLLGGLSNPGTGLNFAVVRLATDGTLDASFNGTGINTSLNFGTGTDEAFAMLVQADGKSVAAGTAYNGSTQVFALTRYLSNGAPDTSWGGTGKVTTSFGRSAPGYIHGVAQQADGKIVAAGYSGSGQVLTIARYLTNGSLDNTFGSGGITKPTLGTGAALGMGVVIQGTKIVVVAQSFSGTNYTFGAIRLTSTGSVDSTFGTSGRTTFNFVSSTVDDIPAAIALDSSSRILLAGYTTSPNGNFAVARLTSNGILDSTFGTGGKVTVDFLADDHATAVAVQADGKIVVSGLSQLDDVTSSAAIARLNPDGTLDTAFNPAGTQPGTLTVSVGGAAYGQGLQIQPDQNIVVTGWTLSGVIKKMMAIRMLPDGTLDASF